MAGSAWLTVLDVETPTIVSPPFGKAGNAWLSALPQGDAGYRLNGEREREREQEHERHRSNKAD